jgi:hypothetical protein
MSQIIASLSPAERRTALNLLDHLLEARKQAHEALLAVADDTVDLALQEQAARLSPAARAAAAQRGAALWSTLESALGGLRVMAGTVADRCPCPETWARLEEIDYFLRGQRETLYQADTWEQEVTRPMKAKHKAVITQMKELGRALRGTASRGHPGRRFKYPAALFKYVESLRAKKVVWTEVRQKCGNKFPRVSYPAKLASFIRHMQRHIKAAG